jgi:hypothetical protein
MAEAESPSITRRALVAGSAAVSATVAAGAAEGAAPDAAGAPSGLQPAADPIHAAIAFHARAYAAYVAQIEADEQDDVIMEALCETERNAADALAATVPGTLQGAAAALAYVRMLHERDDYPLLDDYGCYVFIASTETAVRQAARQAHAA